MQRGRRSVQAKFNRHMKQAEDHVKWSSVIMGNKQMVGAGGRQREWSKNKRGQTFITQTKYTFALQKESIAQATGRT